MELKEEKIGTLSIFKDKGKLNKKETYNFLKELNSDLPEGEKYVFITVEDIRKNIIYLDEIYEISDVIHIKNRFIQIDIILESEGDAEFLYSQKEYSNYKDEILGYPIFIKKNIKDFSQTNIEIYIIEGKSKTFVNFEDIILTNSEVYLGKNIKFNKNFLNLVQYKENYNEIIIYLNNIIIRLCLNYNENVKNIFPEIFSRNKEDFYKIYENLSYKKEKIL